MSLNTMRGKPGQQFSIYCIPSSHSAYFDRAFSVQGPKLWNTLPADIRNNTSINRFKRELKRYLLYIN